MGRGVGVGVGVGVGGGTGSGGGGVGAGGFTTTGGAGGATLAGLVTHQIKAPRAPTIRIRAAIQYLNSLHLDLLYLIVHLIMFPCLPSNHT